MNRIALITGIIIQLSVTTVFAQPYPKNYFGNPLDTPFVLAGTFGEIRNDHFHTGIDFSTGNQEGKPVYAAADGYVSRIKVSASGFGKAMYITHPNGYVTVYAHLKKYADAVEKYIHKIQYKKESFEFDEALEPDKIKFKKGSVIAWSGNTGSTDGPHLHFEIRDARTEEPINPLLFGYSVTDNVKPEIKSVRFYPVPGQGVVVDADRPQSFDVVQSAGKFMIPVKEYIQVFGKIGFEFSMTDRQENNPASLGVYSIQLSVDTQQVFSMKYDRLNFSDLRYANAHIDYAAQYDGEGVYERCFRLIGDKLKLYEDTSTHGYFEFLEDGVHDVELTVKDFSGNTSVLNFQLLSYTSLASNVNQVLPEDYFPMVPDKGLAIHKSDVEIIIPANAIYDFLLFTNSASPAKPGYFSSTFEIGDPHVPLHLPVTVSLKPRQLPDALKSKAVIVSFDKRNKPSFEGQEWNGDFLSAKTKHFGKFAVSVDTVAPVISNVIMPDEHGSGDRLISATISDDFSGIKSYRATVDGHWLLMEYDAKNNLLTGDLKGIAENKTHTFEITVTDAVGNATILKHEIKAVLR